MAVIDGAVWRPNPIGSYHQRGQYQGGQRIMRRLTLFFAVAALACANVQAAVINYVANNYTEYFAACFHALGTPDFANCSYEFWDDKFPAMQAVVSNYNAWQFLICPQGRETPGVDCYEYYASFDNAIDARDIALENWAYWANQ